MGTAPQAIGWTPLLDSEGSHDPGRLHHVTSSLVQGAEIGAFWNEAQAMDVAASPENLR